MVDRASIARLGRALWLLPLGAVTLVTLTQGASGCSSSSSGSAAPKGATDSGAADTQTTMGTDASEDAVDAAPSCSQGCPMSSLTSPVCVESVQASLVDPTGAPVAGQPLFVCGFNLCTLPQATDKAGHSSFFVCQDMEQPALKFLGAASYVSFASAVSQQDTTFAPITLFALPATGQAFPMGGGTVTSGPVSLKVAAGAVTFDPSQPNEPNIQEFRATEVDLAKVPVAPAASLGIAAIWGLAPVNATLTPAATLTIPNGPGWAAGAKVDFYMNGVEPEVGTAVPYGTWGPVGTGTVSADGKTITTDPGSGNGLPVLSMVGVRLHM